MKKWDPFLKNLIYNVIQFNRNQSIHYSYSFSDNWEPHQDCSSLCRYCNPIRNSPNHFINVSLKFYSLFMSLISLFVTHLQDYYASNCAHSTFLDTIADANLSLGWIWTKCALYFPKNYCSIEKPEQRGLPIISLSLATVYILAESITITSYPYWEVIRIKYYTLG